MKAKILTITAAAVAPTSKVVANWGSTGATRPKPKRNQERRRQHHLDVPGQLESLRPAPLDGVRDSGLAVMAVGVLWVVGRYGRD